jgi:hypothetical protein
MPPAANPCELTWIKKLGEVLKERKPWIFRIQGFLVVKQKF